MAVQEPKVAASDRFYSRGALSPEVVVGASVYMRSPVSIYTTTYAR